MYVGRTILQLGNAYFADVCFDQAINKVRSPCLADIKRLERHDSSDYFFFSLICDLTH